MDDLTRREQEILRHLAHGLSDKEIAYECEIALATVRTHTKNLFRKLGVHNRVQAAMIANVIVPEHRYIDMHREHRSTSIHFHGWIDDLDDDCVDSTA